jgi:hypothetical protein
MELLLSCRFTLYMWDEGENDKFIAYKKPVKHFWY